jgi:cytoskeletal protein CcmA (bactofilin family)
MMSYYINSNYIFLQDKGGKIKMIGNKKNISEVSDDYIKGTADTTIIGSTTQFEGKINSSGIMRVNGSISGELNSKGHLIVGQNGSIKENINVNKLTISGSVEGKVNCNGALEITQDGVLNADIQVGSIKIDDGAIFNGKCTMIKKQPVL